MNHYKLDHHQAGASLLIALVMLLIITILAIAGARESSLETRITGNMLEQNTLANYAEAALREGQTQLLKFNRPLEPTENCTETDVCFLNDKAEYKQDFSDSIDYNLNNLSGYSIKWYALRVPFEGDETSANCDNIEYGTCLAGIGSFYYELNAEAENTATGQKINLRSTVVKVFTN